MKHFIHLVLVFIVVSCSNDTSLPPYTPLAYLEDFEDAEDNTILDLSGFTNQAETGTPLWTEQLFDDNGYTELVNDSGTPSAAWLITPPIDLGATQRILHFQSAQHHLPPEGSKLEVFISTNYNGTNINSANWIPIPAITPTIYTEWYRFVASGEVNLSVFTGIVHIAFMASHTAEGAGYYVDNIKVY